MPVPTASLATGARARLRAADCRLDDFVALVDAAHRSRRLPACRPGRPTTCSSTTPRRCGRRSSPTPGGTPSRPSWSGPSPTGPGIVVLAGAYADPTVVDRATAAFDAMIADQRAAGATAGDHFAKPGANDRVWNALEKLAVRDPETFVDYYANDMIALVSRAWLGPGYQVTSQVNVVRPGGQAQDPHRDYHLGFLVERRRRGVPDPRAPAVTRADAAGCRRALRHAGRERPDDVPALLAPVRRRLPRVATRRVPRLLRSTTTCSCPLAKGDAAFFNPALFHGAGTNVSSRHPARRQPAPGLVGVRTRDGGRRPREDLPGDLPGPGRPHGGGRRPGAGRQRHRGLRRGLPVPDQPRPRPARRGRLTPPSQAEVVRQAVAENWSAEALGEAFAAYDERRRTDDI